jgi:hypothetical protein
MPRGKRRQDGPGLILATAGFLQSVREKKLFGFHSRGRVYVNGGDWFHLEPVGKSGEMHIWCLILAVLHLSDNRCVRKHFG